MTMKTTLSLGLLALLSSSTSSTNAQDTGNPADTGNHVTPPEPAVTGQVDHWDMWNWTGAQSVYWVGAFIPYSHALTLSVMRVSLFPCIVTALFHHLSSTPSIVWALHTQENSNILTYTLSSASFPNHTNETTSLLGNPKQ